MADDRLGHVADVVAAGGQAPLGAPVGVAVDGQRGSAPVDRLAEQVAAEERQISSRSPRSVSGQGA